MGARAVVKRSRFETLMQEFEYKFIYWGAWRTNLNLAHAGIQLVQNEPVPVLQNSVHI